MGNYRIFAIEDSVTYQNVYRKVLSSDKFDLTVLGEGKDVCRLAEENLPDLIVMDVNLPDGNGIELCARLYSQEKTKDIPVIIVTSEEDVSVLESAYRAGALDYLRKPFNNMELIIRIENILRLVEKNREIVRLKQDYAVASMGHSVAHFINQPLTSVLGAAEMLEFFREQRPYDKETSELLDMIVSGCREIAKLVQNIENAKTYKPADAIRDLHIIDLKEKK